MLKFLRPFFRRFLIIVLPLGVEIRARNPDTFNIEKRVLLDRVCFVIYKIFLNNVNKI